MFGLFEKINFRSLTSYIGNSLENLYIFAFTIDGTSGFKVKVKDFFASIYAKLTDIEAKADKAIEIANGAHVGIVFDSTAQLNAWIAGTYVRPDGQVPADLNVGASIYIRAVNEPDYWWDGKTYYAQEDKTNLDDYVAKTDITQVLGTSATSIISQKAITGFFGKLINIKPTDVDTAWGIWSPDKNEPLTDLDKLAKISEAESFLGKSQSFWTSDAQNIIRYAGSLINCINISSGSVAINSYGGTPVFALSTNGSQWTQQANGGEVKIVNGLGQKVLRVDSGGSLALLGDAVEAFAIRGGYIYINTTAAAELLIEDKMLCIDASHRVKPISLANFATKADLGNITNDYARKGILSSLSQLNSVTIPGIYSVILPSLHPELGVTAFSLIVSNFGGVGFNYHTAIVSDTEGLPSIFVRAYKSSAPAALAPFYDIRKKGQLTVQFGATSQEADYSVIIQVSHLVAKNVIVQLEDSDGNIQYGVPTKINRGSDNIITSVVLSFGDAITSLYRSTILKTS